MAAARRWMDELTEAADLAAALVESAHTDVLPWVRWTPAQDRWLRLNPKSGAKLFRAGNQAIGKSWAQMQEVIWRATGTHPHYATRTPPVEIWVCCTSWSQSVAIQNKFWALVPKDQLTPRTRKFHTARNGWGKDNPTAEFLNGSMVRFRTTNQGAEAQAGATIDYVAIDEPPDEEVYRELKKRVERRGGQVGLSLTPINKPCEWLRELVRIGAVEEVHAKLEAANMIPIGASEPLRLDDGTVMDQAWIDYQRRTTPAMWAPVILDGEWETRPEGVFFRCFDAARHVRSDMRLDPKRGPIHWVLGFDYAAADREIGHCAVLSQVQVGRDSKGRPIEAIYAYDEVALVGTASNRQFAKAVVAMLDSHGLRWSQLHMVHGDNPVESRWVEKSNTHTMRSIAQELDIPYNSLFPTIRNAKDDVSSAAGFAQSCQYVYERMATGSVIIHPRCKTLIKGFETWDYTKTHPYKDAIDAFRYGIKPFCFTRPHQVPVQMVVRGRA